MKRHGKARRVVVVGAGPGGLGCAMLLARAGCEVTVLERLDRVGGRTSTLEADGFRFDLGPTFFLYPETLRSIFRICGHSLDDQVELIRLEPQYRLIFGDGARLDATADVPRMRRQIAGISPGDADGFVRFLDDNRRKLEAFRPVLQSPFNGLRDVLRLPLVRLLPLLRPWASVDRDLGRFFRDPRVRLAFSFQSKYLGMSPFQCPSLFTILAFLEYGMGVFHPRGGCGAVSLAMARTAETLGASIRLGEPVERLRFEGRRAIGVETAGGRYACDAVVLNADFAHAMRTLVPDGLRRRWSDARIDRKRFSCSTFMLYLGVEGEFPDQAHHTIHLCDDYRGNLADIDTHFRLTASPSFYVQNASVTDATLAPPGMSALYVLVPVPHRHPNVDWAVERERFRRVALDQLAKVGFGDLEPRIRFEKVLTPDDWERGLNIHLGATFNLAHSLDQMLHLRPRNRFEDLDGVYLVGGGTHPGSGLPVIYESARITARLLADDLGLDAGWEDPGPAEGVGAPPRSPGSLARTV